MTPRKASRDVPASVRQRLLNLARGQGVDFEGVLQRYAVERFLYRLSASDEVDRFTLKGAALLRMWTGQELRPTRDVDFLARGPRDEAAIRTALRDVCGTACREGASCDGRSGPMSTGRIASWKPARSCGASWDRSATACLRRARSRRSGPPAGRGSWGLRLGRETRAVTEATDRGEDVRHRRFRPYPEYKESGVDWLGGIPAHWEVERLKSLATLNDETLSESTDPSFEMTYVDISSVDAVTGIAETETIVFEKAPSRARRVVRGGDVIVSTVRTYLRAIAAIEAPESNLIVPTGFAVIRPRQLQSSFASYALRAPHFVERVVADSVGVSYPAINASSLACFPIPYPEVDEQCAIAAFLDRETAKMDALVARKERLIELLQEKRTALITRAVTRGLDPNVPMKDSGVEWLGEIPKHWEVKRINQSAKILRGKFTHRPRNDPSLYDGSYPFIQTGEVSRAQKVVTGYRQTLNERGLAVSKMFPAGTLVMTIAANIGDVAILDFAACFPDSIVGFVPRDGVHRDYLYYAFLAMKPELLREAPVNTQGNLNVERIGSQGTQVPLPGVAEQCSISSFLDGETARVDALIAKVREAIDRLQEFRTALISAAVTGKIDVREAVPR